MDKADPPKPIIKETPVTNSELYLYNLCKKTFLNLWSYPNIYSNLKGCKEVCDLIVVFRNHVILFSDKEIPFGESIDIRKEWARWYRRAVLDSANQIWGAERRIVHYPDSLFTDRACTQPFPVPLPTNPIFHRIVVAHGTGEPCKRFFKGGSGSLIIDSRLVGDQHLEAFPFTVGQVDPTKGFVHILDDTSLDIVIGNLDTVSDFVSYLEKKESFLSSDIAVCAVGEEELLAIYLSKLNENNEHDFILEKKANLVSFDQGFWNEFEKHPQRIAQKQANEISYAWDSLIESFTHHLLNDTQYFRSSHRMQTEVVLRWMAAESRFRRRYLAEKLLEFLSAAPTDRQLSARTIPSRRTGEPWYVFVALSKPADIDEVDYRKTRLYILNCYCLVTRLRNPEALDIVGIATETGLSEVRSEDVGYYNGRDWDDEAKAEAEMFMLDFNLSMNIEMREETYHEYPNVQKCQIPTLNLKGRFRNQLCPCKSGKKAKHCCHK